MSVYSNDNSCGSQLTESDKNIGESRAILRRSVLTSVSRHVCHVFNEDTYFQQLCKTLQRATAWISFQAIELKANEEIRQFVYTTYKAPRFSTNSMVSTYRRPYRTACQAGASHLGAFFSKLTTHRDNHSRTSTRYINLVQWLTSILRMRHNSLLPTFMHMSPFTEARIACFFPTLITTLN